MIKAILFDRDGIIINSESASILSVIKTFNEMGIEISEEDKKQVIGKHPVDYINYFKERYTFSVEEFIKNEKKNYQTFFQSVKLFEKTIASIKKLKSIGYILALTTTAGLNSTKKIIKMANLENVFNVIVTFEDCNNRKPHPDPYLITAKKLGVKPKDCIVIEDSSIGLEAAKNANMLCIVIPNEHTKDQNFSKADFIINDPNEIEIILNKQNSTLPEH